jgi:hypothetical protein
MLLNPQFCVLQIIDHGITGEHYEACPEAKA